MINNFKTVRLVTTYGCNNKCNWCYARPDDLTMTKVFPRKKIKSTLIMLKQLGVQKTVLIGGEPTLYPYLFELLDEHKRQKIKTVMVTNGRWLADGRFSKELAKKGVHAVSISIEGFDSKTHDETTCVDGSYQETLEGIDAANEAGMVVFTNSVITRRNYLHLEKIIDSLRVLPVKQIRFSICGPCFGDNTNNLSVLSPRIASRYFENAYRYGKYKGLGIKLLTPIPLCHFDKDSEVFKAEGVIRGGPCQLISGKMFVLDCNGDILPCAHLTGHPYFNMWSDITNLSSQEFLSKYNLHKNIHKNIAYKLKKLKKICKNRDCSENCSGGCPLFWTYFSPRQEIEIIRKSEKKELDCGTS